MLGGVAAMVAASDFGPLPGDLVLHATMHHDGTGLGSKYALLTEGPSEGYGINGEPSGLAIHTGNGGAFKFEISLKGTPAHISRMESAIDTLGPAVDIYAALVDHEFAHEPTPRLPDLPRLVVGELLAGRAAAAVADETVIRGDVTDVKTEIVEIVNRVLPDDVKRRVRITGFHQPYLGAVGTARRCSFGGARADPRRDGPGDQRTSGTGVCHGRRRFSGRRFGNGGVWSGRVVSGAGRVGGDRVVGRLGTNLPGGGGASGCRIVIATRRRSDGASTT